MLRHFYELRLATLETLLLNELFTQGKCFAQDSAHQQPTNNNTCAGIRFKYLFLQFLSLIRSSDFLTGLMSVFS